MSELFEPQEAPKQESTEATPAPVPPVEPEVKPAQTVDVDTLFADQLSNIKTSDGRQKYADVNTALTSIPHAQTHIQSLENQVAELNEKLNKFGGMEEMISRMQATQETNPEQPSVNSLDEASIAALVEQTITQKETAKVAQANEAAFSKSLIDKYGEKAKEVLDGKVQQLGISETALQQLAQQSPEAALQFFGDNAQTASQSTIPTNTVQNLTAPAAPDKKDAALKSLMGGSDPLISKWREAAPQTD